MTPYEDSNYYIYRHSCPITHECVYIGLGQYDRAWSVRRTHRGKEHFDWLSELTKTDYTLDQIVSITHKHLTKTQALGLEKELISTVKPAFNKLSNPEHWQKGRTYDKGLATFAKTLNEMGYGYVRISYLMGGGKNYHMKAKRMIANAE
jgi:hypothetical protein